MLFDIGRRQKTIEFTDQAALPTRTLPTVTRAITPPKSEGATPIDMVLTLPAQDAKGAKPHHARIRPMQWKDTINVPMKTTARFLVTFDERPGQWMFHCHILDHAEGGLMGTVVVGDAPTVEHIHKTAR